MPNTTVDLPVEVSNLTADAVRDIANSVEKSPEQIAAFLLRKGFSNLSRTKNSNAASLRR